MAYDVLKQFRLRTNTNEGEYLYEHLYHIGDTASAAELTFFVYDLLLQEAIGEIPGSFKISSYELLSGVRNGSNGVYTSTASRAPGTAAALVACGVLLGPSEWSNSGTLWILNSTTRKPENVTDGPFALYQRDPAPLVPLRLAVEELSGTKNAINTVFTSAHAAFGSTGLVVAAGVPQPPSVSGSTWTLPYAPDTDDPQPWALYVWEDSMAPALRLVSEVPIRSGLTVTMAGTPDSGVLLKVNSLVSPGLYTVLGNVITLPVGFPAADALDTLLVIYQEVA